MCLHKEGIFREGVESLQMNRERDEEGKGDAWRSRDGLWGEGSWEVFELVFNRTDRVSNEVRGV